MTDDTAQPAAPETGYVEGMTHGTGGNRLAQPAAPETERLRAMAVRAAPKLSDLRDAFCAGMERIHIHLDGEPYCSEGRRHAYAIRERLIDRLMERAALDTTQPAAPETELLGPLSEAEQELVLRFRQTLPDVCLRDSHDRCAAQPAAPETERFGHGMERDTDGMVVPDWATERAKAAPETERLRRRKYAGAFAQPAAPETERLSMAAICGWVFKSGWAKGERCGATAWYGTAEEPRCKAHRADQPAAPETGPCPRCGGPEHHWRGYPDGWACDPREVAAFRAQPAAPETERLREALDGLEEDLSSADHASIEDGPAFASGGRWVIEKVRAAIEARPAAPETERLTWQGHLNAIRRELISPAPFADSIDAAIGSALNECEAAIRAAIEAGPSSEWSDWAKESVDP